MQYKSGKNVSDLCNIKVSDINKAQYKMSDYVTGDGARLEQKKTEENIAEQKTRNSQTNYICRLHTDVVFKMFGTTVTLHYQFLCHLQRKRFLHSLTSDSHSSNTVIDHLGQMTSR